METWEFLLQKQGTRSWLPLQTRKVSLGTGQYRLVAQGCPPSIDVEIQVFYQTLERDNPQRRSQKRMGRTSEEGLIVIVPFTELRPGLWELHISSPQVRALWGADWQDVLQIKVKPAPTAAPPPSAAQTPSSPDPIPLPQRAAAYQPRFSLTEPASVPPETNPAILLDTAMLDTAMLDTGALDTGAAASPTLSLPQPGVADREAQPWLANLPPLALIDAEPTNPQSATALGEPDPFTLPLPTAERSAQPAPPSSAPPAPPADSGGNALAAAALSLTADEATLALDTVQSEIAQSEIALTPEILAADAVGFEPPPHPEPTPASAATPLGPELTNHPHALLEQSIHSLEQILQQVSEPGEGLMPPPMRTASPEPVRLETPHTQSVRVEKNNAQSPKIQSNPIPDAVAVSPRVDVPVGPSQVQPDPLLTPTATAERFSLAAAAIPPFAASDASPAALAPEIEAENDFLPAPLTSTALPALPLLDITLAEDTFIRHRNEPILISGHVDLQTDESSPLSSRLDQGFSGFLHYELRDPQTQAELLTVEQPLQDATLPLVFNYLLDVPTAYATRLVLGEVRLTITDPAFGAIAADRPLAQQTFSITAGLADLLDTVRQTPTPPLESEPPRRLQMPIAQPSSPLAASSSEPSRSQPTSPTILPPKLPQAQAGSRKLPELPSFGNPPPADSTPTILPWGAPAQQSSRPSPEDTTPLPAHQDDEAADDLRSSDLIPGEFVLAELVPEETAAAALDNAASAPPGALPLSIASAQGPADAALLSPSAMLNPGRYQPIPELPVEQGSAADQTSIAALAHPPTHPQPNTTESNLNLPEPEATEPDAFEALQLGDRFLKQLSNLAAEPLAAAGRDATDSPAAPVPAAVGMPTDEHLLGSDWPMQEFVVDDEPDDSLDPVLLPAAPLAPLQYDASGLPYPQQFQDPLQSTFERTPDWLSPDNPPPPAALMQTPMPTPNAMPTPSTSSSPPATPELILPQGELIAGDLALVRVTLKAQLGLVYVKLWVKDCETRQLLDGPRAFVDFETIAPGELETMTQVVVPLGSPAVRFEAIAIDVTTSQESRKASCERTVVPPDFSQFNLEGASVLPLSEG